MSPLDTAIKVDLQEQLLAIKEKDQTDEEIVGTAFAIVDQYIESTYSDAVSDCYKLYLDRFAKSLTR